MTGLDLFEGLGKNPQVNRLQRLVRDLEELSRAEAGELPLELASVAPISFIETAVPRLELQFEEKRVALQKEYPNKLPKMLVDQARMTQVMLNLLGNALQYTPPEGQVIISTWANTNHITIVIQDSGIGIPDDALPHIFERFYRLDKSRSRAGGGSGIGLTISKHIVEAHNGRLTAASPGLNQSSTFTIYLPVKS